MPPAPRRAPARRVTDRTANYGRARTQQICARKPPRSAGLRAVITSSGRRWLCSDPDRSPADSPPGCIFIHRRLRRELTHLPRSARCGIAWISTRRDSMDACPGIRIGRRRGSKWLTCFGSPCWPRTPRWSCSGGIRKAPAGTADAFWTGPCARALPCTPAMFDSRGRRSATYCSDAAERGHYEKFAAWSAD
jgi:hypothetical protein